VRPSFGLLVRPAGQSMHSFPFVDDDKLIKLEKISLGVLTDSMRCDTVALLNKHHCSVLMVGSLTACGLGESFIEEDLRESDQQAMFVMGKSLDPTLAELSATDIVSDAAADPMLQRVLKDLPVMDVRPAVLPPERKSLDAAKKTQRDSVNIVTSDGYYTAQLDIGEAILGPSVVEPESVEPRGWSNGTDSRTRRTGSNIPVQVGMVSSPAGQCSGALIGLRIVRTAAHCVIRHTTGGGSPAANNGVRFDYRRDAGSIPVSANSQSYSWGGNYLPLGCGDAIDLNGDGDVNDAGEYGAGYSANPNCKNEDWALIVLPPAWWGSVGATSFGYRGMGAGDLNVLTEHGGYPACGNVDSPSGCVSQAYYRDVSSPCKVASYLNAPDYRLWKNGCDVSPAHSGGAVWERSTLYFLGHQLTQDCAKCSSSHPAPVTALGHNTWLYNYQGQLRNQFPG
jgi:hypothetical protein